MFFDTKILKIVQRATGASEVDTMEFLQIYTHAIFETISTTTLEYVSEKYNMKIKGPQDIANILDNIDTHLKTFPELEKLIEDKIQEIDLEMIRFFRTYAPLGDRAYLEVYLYSKVKEYKELIKNPDNENLKTKHTLISA